VAAIPQNAPISQVAQVGAAATPAALRAPAGGDKTRFVPPGSGPAAGPDPSKPTEMYLDLGAELVAVEGPDQGKHFKLTKPKVTIGRPGSRQNDVTLADDTVSREQARIVFDRADNSFTLFNEGETNLARVNGASVESAVLRENDIVQFGATTLRFRKTSRS